MTMTTTEHPFKRDYLEIPLRLQKIHLECLQKRMVLMPAGVTEYEKNEALLLKITTGAEIKAKQKNIAEREAYYLNYWNKEFLPAIEDLEANYGAVVAQASKREEPEIKDLLAKLTFEETGSVNIELKIYNFKLLKNLLK